MLFSCDTMLLVKVAWENCRHMQFWQLVEYPRHPRFCYFTFHVKHKPYQEAKQHILSGSDLFQTNVALLILSEICSKCGLSLHCGRYLRPCFTNLLSQSKFDISTNLPRQFWQTVLFKDNREAYLCSGFVFTKKPKPKL